MAKKSLINLARQAIKAKLLNENLIVDENIKKEFSIKKASFVTLTLNGELRGCIGSLYPKRELWKDVIENSIHAAFHDPRFPPLSLDELNKIKIEISILSIPEKISYKNEKQLLEKIYKKGLLIQKGYYSATYLPQVWDEIKDPIIFISSLCLKAGLPKNFWKNEKLDFYVYDVEKIKE